MFWNRYLLPAIALSAAVAIANWIGDSRGYYDAIGWYDWPMHFLGGATIAALGLWGIEFLGHDWLAWAAKPLNLVLLVLVVGIGWEIFELACRLNSIHDVGYAWDTTHDLIMDVCGAAIVAWIGNKHA